MLQDMLVDTRTKHDCQIIIMGDMNSRTANLDDFIFNDNMKYIPVNFYKNSDFALLRNNADKETNNFGHSVLNMCKHLDIHIVNGRSKSDQNGEFTYYGNDSCSTIDYALMSSELFSYDYDFIVKPLDEKCYDSDHLPIQLTIKNFRAQDVVTSRKEGSTKSYTKVCWNRNFRDEYLYHIRGRECMNMLNSACLSLDLNNIDKAVSDFESVLFKAAASMIAQNVGNNIKGRAIPWWDSELSTLKQKRNKQLRIFRKHRLKCQLNLYLALKKEFKILYRKKEFNYRKKRRDLLVKHKRGSNEFWRAVKILSAGQRTQSYISSNEWFDHFSNLLNMEVKVDLNQEKIVSHAISVHDQYCFLCENNIPEFLNRPITKEEVISVIQNSKKEKSPGTDGLVNELFKEACATLIPFIVKLFNKIFNLGIFPARWGEAILCPLYKSGNIHDVNNYRGISLTSNFSKIFTKILNNRLVKWAEDNNLLYENQAGYWKGYTTADHIFCLQSLIQKYLSKSGGRVYALFVDFSKEFDRVPHHLLWKRLLDEGVHGRILGVIRSMYKTLCSCVKTSEGLTEFFPCRIGTRQGCMLSPFLFVLYLNLFIRDINAEFNNGIFVTETAGKIQLLLYADDIVCISDTVGRLQQQINKLENYCLKWGMKVNLNKTKVIVFRNGGPLRQNEHWFYQGTEIQAVSSYRYLGVVFTSRLIWTSAKSMLAAQAVKSLISLYKIQYKCLISVETMIYLFRKKIVPISEYCKQVESVQINFCKRILGLSNRSSNAAALGECGLLPLQCIYHVKWIKYWLKILCMDDSRYPKQCYLMLKP